MKCRFLKRILFSTVIACISLPCNVLAYEVNTHEDMSERAALMSSLNEYLPTIGIKSLDEELADISTKQNIVKWLRKGAHDEDDTLSANFARYRNHFYDPQHGGRGYTFGALTGEPSPDWALEDTRTFTTQSYSFKRARQYFYDALTLPNNNREMWMTRTFYTLGHVIHHIEDMAQPQHTRNDSHGGFVLGPKSRYELYTDEHRGELPFSDQNYNAADPVRFETARNFWATGNGKGMAEFSSYNFVSAGSNFRGAFQNGGLIARSNVRYTLPSPSPVTPTFHDANSLFASIGKTPPAECTPLNNPCVMAFFSSEVTDNYRPQPGLVNPKASTASIFDQDLQLYGKMVSYPNLDKCANSSNPDTCEKIETGLIFSLNRFNFDEAHKFLIPRAVAYSAGLIDYFFRGRLEAEDESFTNTGISLRVKNAIDRKKTPAWTNEILYAKNSNGSAGSLIVAFDYQDSAGKTQYGASNPVPLRATDTLVPGQVSDGVYDFALTVPPEAKEVNYRLVFRGRLGQEDDAVAVGKIEPVSGFVVYPNYLPADGISGPRAILKQGGQWKLSEKKDLVAGNVDWKGWYRNGRPTKVLSWSGPTIRYFPDNQSWLRSEIYRDGKIFDYAPADVLAAAVARDTSGVEWVVAICKEGLLDVVYRRLSTKSDPPDPREQWQEIARLDATADDANDGATTSPADIPWFFNGAGTEAQTMRSWRVNNEPYRGQRRKRLIISLNSTLTGAKLDNLGNLDGFRETQTCSGGYDTRGAGSVQSNFRGEGSYIVAVDYKDDQEVRAKVRLDATTTSTSTVTAIEVSKDNYVQVGKTSIDQSWVEYFEWGGQEQIHYFDNKKYTASWSTASSPRQDQVGTIDIRWKYYLYGLDLRDNVYAYTFWNVNHRNEWNTDGLDGRTGTWAEGGEILSKKNPLVNFFGPISFESTTNMQPLGAIGCGQEWSSTRYGSLDFSSPVALGSIAVDTGGNVAASFYYRDIANNQTHGPVNHLSGGSLEGTVPGAPASPEYQPIGVIY